MISTPADQRQPTGPRSDTAQDVWVDLFAEIITAQVLHEESETPDQGNEG